MAVHELGLALVGVTLLPRPMGCTLKDLSRRHLCGLVTRVFGGGEGRRGLLRLHLDALVERQAAIYERGRFALTAAGHAWALSFLGVDELGGCVPWRSIYRGPLMAKALGIARQLTPGGMRTLATADGLRAEVLRQAFALPLDPAPRLAAVREQLVWQLLSRGADADLVRQARSAGNPLSVEAISDLLMLAEAGAVSYVPGQGVRALAAKVTGAASWDVPQLTEAVLLRWLSAERGTPAAAGDGQTVGEGADRDFAARVLQAARGTRTGRVGARRVFVSHVWRQLARDGMNLALDDLKRRLLAAHRSGQLVLSKADMPQLHDVHDVESSRIVHRSTEFVFVEV